MTEVPDKTSYTKRRRLLARMLAKIMAELIVLQPQRSTHTKRKEDSN